MSLFSKIFKTPRQRKWAKILGASAAVIFLSTKICKRFMGLHRRVHFTKGIFGKRTIVY